MTKIEHNIETELEILERKSGIPLKKIKIEDVDIAAVFKTNPAFKYYRRFYRKARGKFPIPSNIQELLQAYGVIAGTGTWTGNAEILIKNGTEWNDIIAYRDDVVPLLTRYGVGEEDASRIMEYVRKGLANANGFDDRDLEIMKKCNVPERYIESMRKIKYLSPKDRATVYISNLLKKEWYRQHLSRKEFKKMFRKRFITERKQI